MARHKAVRIAVKLVEGSIESGAAPFFSYLFARLPRKVGSTGRLHRDYNSVS